MKDASPNASPLPSLAMLGGTEPADELARGTGELQGLLESLQACLARRESVDFGAFARVVQSLHAELSLMADQTAALAGHGETGSESDFDGGLGSALERGIEPLSDAQYESLIALLATDVSEAA